jgi:hypothetical protein
VYARLRRRRWAAPDDPWPRQSSRFGACVREGPGSAGPINDAKGQSMSIKLTDTQLVILSDAAQRKDRCLVASPNLKGGAALKVANNLISAGFVEEMGAEAGAPIWRRDNETGQAYALKLRAAGDKAIGIQSVDPENAHNKTAALENRDQEVAVSSKVEARDAPQLREPASAGPSAPRGGSKLAQVIEFLQRDYSATIDELIAATGWLPHTTRAALTGLRKRGYAVAINRSDKERRSFYHIKAEGDGWSVVRSVEVPAESPTSQKPAQAPSRPRVRRAA